MGGGVLKHPNNHHLIFERSLQSRTRKLTSIKRGGVEPATVDMKYIRCDWNNNILTFSTNKTTISIK